MTAKNVLLADDDTRLKGVECSAENSPSSRPPSKLTAPRRHTFSLYF